MAALRSENDGQLGHRESERGEFHTYRADAEYMRYTSMRYDRKEIKTRVNDMPRKIVAGMRAAQWIEG